MIIVFFSQTYFAPHNTLEFHTVQIPEQVQAEASPSLYGDQCRSRLQNWLEEGEKGYQRRGRGRSILLCQREVRRSRPRTVCRVENDHKAFQKKKGLTMGRRGVNGGSTVPSGERLLQRIVTCCFLQGIPKNILSQNIKFWDEGWTMIYKYILIKAYQVSITF